MDQLRFTIPEILTLIGVSQCVYILVYIFFRAGILARAALPLVYFFVLGLAFFCDFSQSYLYDELESFRYIQWFAWFYGAPLSVLLIVQIAQISKVPALRHYWVLLLPPLAFYTAHLLSEDTEMMDSWLVVTGLVANAISLLAIWTNRGIFESILAQKAGRERYWLILCLIVMNVGFLTTMLLGLHSDAMQDHIVMVRTMLGLGGVYLVTTSLFRIYPQAVYIRTGADRLAGLSESELYVAERVEGLMKREKVYQEPAYSRADLARECGVSEAVISKVTNEYFHKSLPQMLNEYRVDDAKMLLKQTDAPVNVIAEEVGFNSLPSFNRVFKASTGLSPSAFRGGKVV